MSRQDYGTPSEFFAAVAGRFGAPSCDLAACPENAACSRHFSERDDSLAQDWTGLSGVLWLNPPFRTIDPWAAKCSESAGPGRTILMLTPASIGTNWFRDHVLGRALVLGLNPRLTFVGETAPYPKDLMLSVWDGYGTSGFGQWEWAPRGARRAAA
jgi:phage N-6-adenine-methyltransferase